MVWTVLYAVLTLQQFGDLAAWTTNVVLIAIGAAAGVVACRGAARAKLRERSDHSIEPHDSRRCVIGRSTTGTSGSTYVRLPHTIRAAALLFAFLGVAFGASVPFVLADLDRFGELPMMFWFRAMAGPFEQLGPRSFSVLGWTFVGICAADVVAGSALWQGRRWGARLGLVTSPLALALGVGFGLPLILVGVPIRVALVLAGCRSLD